MVHFEHHVDLNLGRWGQCIRFLIRRPWLVSFQRVAFVRATIALQVLGAATASNVMDVISAYCSEKLLRVIRAPNFVQFWRLGGTFNVLTLFSITSANGSIRCETSLKDDRFSALCLHESLDRALLVVVTATCSLQKHTGTT